DFDVLDLSGYGWARTDIAYSGSESGTVTFYDTNGAVLGTMDFAEIEQVVPCFASGTLVDTPDGPRPVESIRPGDLVLTLDDGPQPVRWCGQRRLGLADLLADPSLHPVEIAAGALREGVPECAVRVSPQHRVMFAGAECELFFGAEEVLVPAIQMVGRRPGIRQQLSPVVYVHLMFDRHQILSTHGMWSESFQPGDRVLDGMPDPQRDELLRLFPDLEAPQSYPAARMTLKRHETRVLMQA
ncbi:MAG TPA: Hint domain-containing protein, partial [Tabrizicola sp.]